MEPFAAAKFLLDFAKSIIGWYGDAKTDRTKDAKQISDYLNAIANSLSEYAELIRKGDDLGHGHMIRNRYYLESSLSNLAWVIDSNNANHPAKSAIARLKAVKVHDGALVPEVSSMLEGSNGLTSAKKEDLVNEMQRAAGEFKAAADFIIARV